MIRAVVISVIVLATFSSACDTMPLEQVAPAQLFVGEPIHSVITTTDHQCHSLNPCRVYELVAPRAGQIKVLLDWAGEDSGLRLEVWSGDEGQSACCTSGERVSLAAQAGQIERVRVTLVREPRSHRQAFELQDTIDFDESPSAGFR